MLDRTRETLAKIETVLARFRSIESVSCAWFVWKDGGEEYVPSFLMLSIVSAFAT
jgi:hypothetical protein